MAILSPFSPSCSLMSAPTQIYNQSYSINVGMINMLLKMRINVSVGNQKMENAGKLKVGQKLPMSLGCSLKTSQRKTHNFIVFFSGFHFLSLKDRNNEGSFSWDARAMTSVAVWPLRSQYFYTGCKKIMQKETNAEKVIGNHDSWLALCEFPSCKTCCYFFPATHDIMSLFISFL